VIFTQQRLVYLNGSQWLFNTFFSNEEGTKGSVQVKFTYVYYFISLNIHVCCPIYGAGIWWEKNGGDALVSLFES